MNSKRYSIRFCRKFNNLKLPKVKFKDFGDNYKIILRRDFGLEQDDINKATFTILIITFILSLLLSIIFLKIHITIIFFYSFIISILLAYSFNLRLYKLIYKDEMKLNALLYLIKIYFSILKNSFPDDSDFTVTFINLIKDFNLPISKNFKTIIKNIQEGYIPEKELFNFVSSSEDFNKYLKMLLIENFRFQGKVSENEFSTLEDKFKIYLRQIETRLSIIFFIGLFFPLGLGFLVLFNRINIIILILIIPFFFIVQKMIFTKFIRSDVFLLGMLNNFSKKEQMKFQEFLSFLKLFAKKLQLKFSPEKAFINSYHSQKDQLVYLKESLKSQTICLVNFECSFNEMLDLLQKELKNFRYWIIIDVLKRILIKNAYDSSEKILNILSFISNHKKLEKKLEIIIKGEKFKVLLFLFLLPIITGAIGGMFPLFILITENNLTNIFIDVISNEFLIIFFCLLSCNIISSYFFLKIVKYERFIYLILISCIEFVLTFFISYFLVLNLI